MLSNVMREMRYAGCQIEYDYGVSQRWQEFMKGIGLESLMPVRRIVVRDWPSMELLICMEKLPYHFDLALTWPMGDSSLWQAIGNIRNIHSIEFYPRLINDIDCFYAKNKCGGCGGSTQAIGEGNYCTGSLPHLFLGDAPTPEEFEYLSTMLRREVEPAWSWRVLDDYTRSK